MKFTKVITHTVELTDEEIDALIERYDMTENYEEGTPKTEMITDLLDEIIPYDYFDLIEMGIKCDYNTDYTVEGAEA